MRNSLLLAVLAGLAIASPLAAAQQSSSLVLYADSPTEAIGAHPTTVSAVAIFTADYTAATAIHGIPVEYVVTAAPEWLSVTLSPASDVFPTPQAPSGGAAYSVARTFQVTMMTSHDLTERLSGVLEITAITGASPMGRSTEGRMTIPVVSAVETPCPEHVAADAAAPSETPFESASPEAGEVTVQQAGATPLPTPWLVVAAFGLVGAGVAIVLRQRTQR